MLNNSPYDLAAAVLCLEEAGAVVTDARGEPLGGRAAARLGPRVPDVVRRGRQPLLYTPSSSQRSSAESSVFSPASVERIPPRLAYSLQSADVS